MHNYAIQIIFVDVFFIQCLYKWKTDTTKDVFYVPNIDETKKYWLWGRRGFFLCGILAEDIESPIY